MTKHHLRSVLSIMIVSLVVAPTVLARPRPSKPPSQPVLTYTIAMPAAERLATGIGIGVLYDTTVLRFTGFSETAPDVFYFSPGAELVDDPPHMAGQTAMLRLTWISASGRWTPALQGGNLTTLHFERLSDAIAELRVVSLSTDESHSFAAAMTLVPADASASGCRLDTREIEVSSTAIRSRPLQTFPAGQCTPDVDGNGRLDALTDGIVILRYLFGFSGSALTAGAIGTGATRSTPAAVSAFLSQSDCVGLLDIDQSSRADALTDGILLLRQLFGFSGSELVIGALAPNAGRTSPDALMTTIQSYAVPRDVLVSGASILSGNSITDAGGDFLVTAVGGGVTVSLTQGTDFDGNRTLDIARGGSGEISVVLPPVQAGPPASPPVSASALGFRHVGSLADVASLEWDSFGKKWFYTCGAENRLPESIQQTAAPLVSSQACLTPFNKLHLTQYTPARLMSGCSVLQPSCYQSPTSKGAVLFVHGFTPFMFSSAPEGGGSDTWGALPNLVQSAGFIPFEFRWITAARFDDVAVELGAAIKEVATKTGRKVHIVAHSFGGLLVRQLLQSSLGPSAMPYIADVVTLGTPHSGITDSNICPGPASLPVPTGSDNSLLAWCKQISCYQAGLNNLSSINNGASAATLRSAYSLDGDAGYLIGRLAQSVNSFPAVDWLALMGLVTRGLFSANTFGTGDDLISYAGQRFLPSMSLAGACPGNGVTTPLSTASPQGGGRLWERVLGFTGQPVPGGALTAATDPTFTGGYAHNAVVINNLVDWFPKQEAKVDCTAIVGCKHDTVLYLLGTDSTHSFFNGLSWLDAHAGSTIASETIRFHVTVLDSVTRIPVQGAIVSILYGAIGPSATTGLTGEASLTVPFEASFTYALRIRATGYVSLQDSFSAGTTSAATPRELGTRLLVSQSSVGYGTLGGTVQNAVTGVGISNATVSVRRSDRQPQVFSGTTASNGVYNAGSLAAGTYVVSATATGFAGGSSEVSVLASTTNTGNVPLSPELASGQARIVLTWGTDPRDLDSHLQKLRADGTLEYHIYYGAKLGTNNDNLDVDDISSFGPETVTIQSVDPSAHYTYWVHLYSGFGTIASSPTRVTVTIGTTTLTFNAPASATGSDWVVFEIVNGQVVPCSGSCNVVPLSANDVQADGTKRDRGGVKE